MCSATISSAPRFRPVAAGRVLVLVWRCWSETSVAAVVQLDSLYFTTTGVDKGRDFNFQTQLANALDFCSLYSVFVRVFMVVHQERCQAIF